MRKVEVPVVILLLNILSNPQKHELQIVVLEWQSLQLGIFSSINLLDSIWGQIKKSEIIVGFHVNRFQLIGGQRKVGEIDIGPYIHSLQFIVG